MKKITALAALLLLAGCSCNLQADPAQNGAKRGCTRCAAADKASAKNGDFSARKELPPPPPSEYNGDKRCVRCQVDEETWERGREFEAQRERYERLVESGMSQQDAAVIAFSVPLQAEERPLPEVKVPEVPAAPAAAASVNAAKPARTMGQAAPVPQPSVLSGAKKKKADPREEKPARFMK